MDARKMGVFKGHVDVAVLYNHTIMKVGPNLFNCSLSPLILIFETTRCASVGCADAADAHFKVDRTMGKYLQATTIIYPLFGPEKIVPGFPLY